MWGRVFVSVRMERTCLSRSAGLPLDLLLFEHRQLEIVNIRVAGDDVRIVPLRERRFGDAQRAASLDDFAVHPALVNDLIGFCEAHAEQAADLFSVVVLLLESER